MILFETDCAVYGVEIFHDDADTPYALIADWNGKMHKQFLTDEFKVEIFLETTHISDTEEVRPKLIVCTNDRKRFYSSKFQ